VLTGRRLGNQPASRRAKTPSTPRWSTPIRFSMRSVRPRLWSCRAWYAWPPT